MACFNFCVLKSVKYHTINYKSEQIIQIAKNRDLYCTFLIHINNIHNNLQLINTNINNI